jgi:hypothetical protein
MHTKFCLKVRNYSEELGVGNEIMSEIVDCIYVPENRNQRRDLVEAVVNIRLHNCGRFLD